MFGFDAYFSLPAFVVALVLLGLVLLNVVPRAGNRLPPAILGRPPALETLRRRGCWHWRAVA